MTATSLPPQPLPYQVEVIRSAKRNKTVSARIVDGTIRVRIPAWMSSEDEHQYVADVVARIEEKRRCTHIDLEARAGYIAEHFNLPAPDSIRWSTSQRYRWGSCTIHSRDVRISSRLAEVPPWVLDHVIVHELAHLVVPDHSRAFQALVNRNPLAERATGYLMAFSELAAAPEATEAQPRRAG